MSNICNNVYNTVLLHVDSSGLCCSTVIVAGATGGWEKKNHAAFGFVFRVSDVCPSCVVGFLFV